VSNNLFKCKIAVCLPLCTAGDPSPLSFTVAEYDFDPGLYPQDMIRINGTPLVRTRRNDKLVLDDGPKFSFDAQVLRRRKIINFDKPESSFILLIELEIADKEQLPEIIKLYKETFPGTYEDYQLNPEVEEE
jgi:hypothetical protein